MATLPRQALAHAHRAQSGRMPQTLGTALTRVALRNFKGHADLRLDLGKITVLTGPTGSGKSTVLQALNLLNSALQAGNFGILRGRNQEYGSFADIVTRRDEGAEVGIGVDGVRTVRTEECGDVAADFSYGVSFGSSLDPSTVRATVDMRSGSASPEVGGMRLEHSYGTGADADAVSGPGAAERPITSSRVDGGVAPRIGVAPAESPLARAFKGMFLNGEFFSSLLEGLWHVPFSRTMMSCALPPMHRESALPPGRARGAASPISQIDADLAVREKLSGMMRELGLGRTATRNVPPAKDEGAAPALDFVGAGAPVPVVHEGSGLSSLVSMLAVLACSPRDAVITIEEPEIHLDPAAQAGLLGILVRQATDEGKQIVFTTHSNHLLFPLLAYIAKEEFPLEHGDVAMHYFNTDESGNMAGAERLDINEHGQIPGGLRGFSYMDYISIG